MATVRRQKEALRISILSFIAGIHHVHREVERTRAWTETNVTQELENSRQASLALEFIQLLTSSEILDLFVEILNEEQLYPFGDNWPKEALSDLRDKIIPPRLNLKNIDETDPEEFRYKKGFKEVLETYASGIESFIRPSNNADHWMAQIINTSFYAGVTLPSKFSETPKSFHAAIQEIESDNEPWNRYSQLLHFLEKQLRRETKRKSGLVSEYEF